MGKIFRRVFSYWLLSTALVTVPMSACATPLEASIERRVDPTCVVLLHGLGRSSSSMRPIQRLLEDQEYRVANIDYPSRHHTIESLANKAVEEGLEQCGVAGRIHFVTHSLGGILVRQYLAVNTIEHLGHVVMLGPPNKGSPVVDAYSDWPFVKKFGGPAFSALSPTDGDILTLGPVDFSLGVIAGNKTLNPILSTIIDGPDDGKVHVDDTRIKGMNDYRVVASSHPMLMRNKDVHRHLSYFLKYGIFGEVE